ncbi:MAG: hypothetical protein R2727_07340 [Bacteroidales bacterium]
MQHAIVPAYTTDKVLNYTLVSVTDGNLCQANPMTGSKRVDIYAMPVSDAGA